MFSCWCNQQNRHSSTNDDRFSHPQEVVQETYTTEKINKVVGTQVKDNIIATETKTEISTKTEAADPLQTIYLIAHDSGDPNLAPIGGVGFTNLENQIGTGKYFLDFTADVSSDLTFTLNQRTGEIKPVNGPGSSNGKSAYSNVNGNSDNYVRVMSTEEATANQANILVCKIIPATSYPLGLQCLWGINQIAEFWTCSSRLVLVQPGVDFTSQCTGASTSYNINIEVRLA
uniref:Uncharacterized protein n=1 Tax=Fusarium oxysporum (strain Fo5176) TaxID=660025 RepID=A0A0D2XPH7_FUSOF